MHVHGTHLNLNQPLEMKAAQRAVATRKRLSKNGADEVIPDFAGIEAGSSGHNGRKDGQARDRHGVEANPKGMYAASPEEAEEERTSIWI